MTARAPRAETDPGYAAGGVTDAELAAQVALLMAETKNEIDVAELSSNFTPITTETDIGLAVEVPDLDDPVNLLLIAVGSTTQINTLISYITKADNTRLATSAATISTANGFKDLIAWKRLPAGSPGIYKVRSRLQTPANGTGSILGSGEGQARLGAYRAPIL
jgi:hypothetical protein